MVIADPPRTLGSRAAGHSWQRALRPPVTSEPRPASDQLTPSVREGKLARAVLKEPFFAGQGRGAQNRADLLVRRSLPRCHLLPVPIVRVLVADIDASANRRIGVEVNSSAVAGFRHELVGR